jgi:hypothetical protein
MSINQLIAETPQDTYAQKHELAARINHELRDFGLAVACPRTGAATTLVADYSGPDQSGRSRYRFETRSVHGARRRTATMSRLPELSVVLDVRHEGGERFRDDTGYLGPRGT